MVNLFFFLKFKSQLKKTRPDIIRQFDEFLSRSIADARGKIKGERFIVSAVFNEDTIGFWFDIFILIESLKNKIDTIPDFFGYSLVICNKKPELPELLCRFLANHSGVFVDGYAAKNLHPYVSLEKPFEWMNNIKKRKYESGKFCKIKDFKSFKTSVRNEYEIQNDVTKFIEQDDTRRVLIFEPSYWHIRGSLYSYTGRINSGFPSLTFCFESIGIGAIVDVWSPSIRALSFKSLSGEKHPNTEEIDSLWDFLFRQRIQGEVSDYVKRCLGRFLSLVFSLYFETARNENRIPIVTVENIHMAENDALKILLDSLAEIDGENRQKMILLGTSCDSITEDRIKQVQSVFGSRKTLKIKTNDVYCPKLSSDLWEIIYAISLFSGFFPPEFFPQLFEESGKNPVMISRAFSVLHTLGIIESVQEPRLNKTHLVLYACKTLEEKTGRVEAMVKKLLLNWAVKRNINPSFRLLVILSSLICRHETEGSSFINIDKTDDLLLLRSFLFDITGETCLETERAIDNGLFDMLFSEKAEALRSIYKTSSALINGNENDINNVFSGNQLEKVISKCDQYPVLKARLVINYCCFYLGSYNEKAASSKAKEAILLGQNKNSYGLSQSYRLYSLVCFSKQQINEAIEYLGFALTNAERNGDYYELAVSSYYAAVAQFLFGNMFKSIHYAKKSADYSLIAGCPEWADKSNFLIGRIKFELGQYNEACVIFNELANDPYGRKSGEKENLFSAWVYRTKIYMKEPENRKPENVIFDTDIFEAEAEYFAGNYQKSFEITSSFENPVSRESYFYTERPDWRSGFSQCEQLYFTNGEIQNRLITMFRSLSQSCLTDHMQINCEEALNGIQQILRDDKLCEMDPWDSLYCYAKYCILEMSGANDIDMSTAVSMAFKRLQLRACHIEDSETHNKYLNENIWNRELCKAAKEFKLI